MCLCDSKTRESERRERKRADEREREKRGWDKERDRIQEREGERETERIRDRKNIYSLKYDDVIIDLSQKRVAEKGIGRERKKD